LKSILDDAKEARRKEADQIEEARRIEAGEIEDVKEYRNLDTHQNDPL